MNLTKFIKILTEKLSKTTSKHHNILVVHLNNLIVLYIVVNSVGMFWKTAFRARITAERGQRHCDLKKINYKKNLFYLNCSLINIKNMSK